MSYKIVDTTLRDGEQTPGVLFSIDEKVGIAHLLEKAGVHIIEAGTPANGISEQTAISEILRSNLKASILTWNRALRRDVDCSLVIGARNIHISLPVSDVMIQSKLGKNRQWVLGQLRKTAEYLQAEKVLFSIGAEDATRADKNFLLDYARLAQDLGAERVRLCDTVGISDPFQITRLIKYLNKRLSIELEIHAHNDLGMATANALAAARAGAKAIDTTVIGLGERAGNTPLEEIVLAMHVTLKTSVGIKKDQLKPLAEAVSLAALRPINSGKSVVGDGIFCHESGIHVDGIRKNPITYEPYNPKMVGATRKLLIGKTSGPKAVASKLEELGIQTLGDTSNSTVLKIRELAARQKGGVSDQQIMQIADMRSEARSFEHAKLVAAN